jgi:hypothetical protein
MVALTCFGFTLPSSGSVPSAFWEMLNWGHNTPIHNILSTASQLSMLWPPPGFDPQTVQLVASRNTTKLPGPLIKIVHSKIGTFIIWYSGDNWHKLTWHGHNSVECLVYQVTIHSRCSKWLLSASVHALTHLIVAGEVANGLAGIRNAWMKCPFCIGSENVGVLKYPHR